ncbi:MAG: hypothetical protein Q8R53_05125 [Nanoarchaeota archaeon]|nr:hypothetical protein [Nanoarchaeota archaeon]
MKISKGLAKGMMLVGGVGTLGTIGYGLVESTKIDSELREAGIYRLDEIAAQQRDMLPALGSCYTGYVATGSATEDCTDLLSQYFVLQQEEDALTNAPAYQAALDRREQFNNGPFISYLAMTMGFTMLGFTGIFAHFRRQDEERAQQEMTGGLTVDKQ